MPRTKKPFPAPTRRPTSTSMNCATASPRPGALVRRHRRERRRREADTQEEPAGDGQRDADVRSAWTRSRALNTVSARMSSAEEEDREVERPTHRLMRNSRSTVSDCEIDVVASSTLAGSFFASAGLMVCSALRMVTAASASRR